MNRPRVIYKDGTFILDVPLDTRRSLRAQAIAWERSARHCLEEGHLYRRRAEAIRGAWVAHPDARTDEVNAWNVTRELEKAAGRWRHASAHQAIAARIRDLEANFGQAGKHPALPCCED